MSIGLSNDRHFDDSRNRTATERLLRKATRKYYACSPSRIDRLRDAHDHPLFSAALQNYLDTHASTAHTDISIDDFIHTLDNRIITHINAGTVAENRIADLYARAFQFLVKNDAPSRKACRRRRDREDAFAEALGQLFSQVRRPGFTLARPAVALFTVIYRRQCFRIAGKSTSDGGGEASFDNAAQLLTELGLRPINVLSIDLETLRRYAPECLELCEQYYLSGYSYKELAPQYGLTEQNLRTNRMPSCREKLRRLYERLTS